jgi:hypothetical protein
VLIRGQGKLGGESVQEEDLNLATALWERERMIKRLGGEGALQARSGATRRDVGVQQQRCRDVEMPRDRAPAVGLTM